MLAEFAQVATTLTYHAAAHPGRLQPHRAASPRHAATPTTGCGTSATRSGSPTASPGCEAAASPGSSSSARTACSPRWPGEPDDTDAAYVPLLRRGRPERDHPDHRAGRGCTSAAPRSTGPLLATGGRRVDLPTYAFQQQRYWLATGVAPAGDTRGLGLDRCRPPAARRRPSRWPTPTAPASPAAVRRRPTRGWPTTRSPGTVLLPGTACVELALRAGDEVGCEPRRGADLASPAGAARTAGVQVQVRDRRRRTPTAAAASASTRGRRRRPWTLHATGTLAVTGSAAPPPWPSWPPAGRRARRAVDGFYGAGRRGLATGPRSRACAPSGAARGDTLRRGRAARGSTGRRRLRAAPGAARRRPARRSARRAPATNRPPCPFAWTGVTLHAVGADHAPGAAHPRHRDRRPGRRGRHGAAGRHCRLAGAPPVRHRPARPPKALPVGRRPCTAPSRGPRSSAVGARRWTRRAVRRRRSGARRPPATIRSATVHARRTAATLDRAPAVSCATTDRRGQPPRRGHLRCGGDLARRGRPRPGRTRRCGAWCAPPRPRTRTGSCWSTSTAHDADAALAAALATGEPQLAVRDGALFAPRLARAATGPALIPPAGVRLAPRRPGKGTLDNLALVPVPRGRRAARPGPGADRRPRRRPQLPRRADRPRHVPRRRPARQRGRRRRHRGRPRRRPACAAGDRGDGPVPGAFGPVAVADHRLVTPIPAGWSFAQAAAVPVVFLTAYYGLVDLAGLRPGERCWSTPPPAASAWPRSSWPATSAPRSSPPPAPRKWDTLRGLGVDDDRIASSRTLDFEERVPRRHRRPRRRRGAQLAGRRVRRRLAAAAAPRRPVRRDGQDRHPRPRPRSPPPTPASATRPST